MIKFKNKVHGVAYYLIPTINLNFSIYKTFEIFRDFFEGLHCSLLLKDQYVKKMTG